jgi:hypothetical protein
VNELDYKIKAIERILIEKGLATENQVDRVASGLHCEDNKISKGKARDIISAIAIGTEISNGNLYFNDGGNNVFRVLGKSFDPELTLTVKVLSDKGGRVKKNRCYILSSIDTREFSPERVYLTPEHLTFGRWQEI